jgi:hypothetical protein
MYERLLTTSESVSDLSSYVGFKKKLAQ